jgi:hypothetical protein
MGQKITFRGRGCATETEGAVSTVEPRVKFIKGYEGEGDTPEGTVACGSGTAFPMQVTVDQLAEIFYRVRDAWFTQGEVVEAAGSYFFMQGSPDVDRMHNFYNEDYYPVSLSTRGYCVLDDNKESFGSYFGSGDMQFRVVVDAPGGEYGPGGVDSQYFGDEYSNGLVDMRDGFYRDLLRDEAYCWQGLIESTPPDQLWNACGFNHFMHCSAYGPLSVYGCYVVNDLAQGEYEEYRELGDVPLSATFEASVSFNGQVAWVGADSPLDPAATLYVGLDVWFRFYVLGSTVDPVSVDLPNRSSYNLLYSDRNFVEAYPPAEESSPLKFSLKLSGGVLLSCDLYTSSGYGPNTITGGSDFILEATRWWPYATNSGAAAWDETTGLPVNGGPGA